MPEHAGQWAGLVPLDLAVPLIGLVAVAGYLRLATADRRGWPRLRSLAWVAGCLVGAVAISGPVAARHPGFVSHLATHLLLGMLAPLLLALAAPVTLVLRTLPVSAARRLSRLLASGPARFLTEPVVAAVLSVGGLWALYTTGVYPAIQAQPILHVAVHAHMFLAGYLFTVSMVSVDPLPHRRGHRHRALVLILALAAHDILAKYLYAHPPAGVLNGAAEAGAMLMYYGGAAIDMVLIVLLCARWYHALRPRPSRRPVAVLASSVE